MAIEHAEGVEMPEGGESQSAEESSETLPASLLAGKAVKPGDVVRIEVVSVDDEGGTWEGKYASSPKPLKSESTMDEMASRFKPAKEGMV